MGQPKPTPEWLSLLSSEASLFLSGDCVRSPERATQDQGQPSFDALAPLAYSGDDGVGLCANKMAGDGRMRARCLVLDQKAAQSARIALARRSRPGSNRAGSPAKVRRMKPSPRAPHSVPLPPPPPRLNPRSLI